MQVGDKFFLVGRFMYNMPAVVTVEKVNSKFCTVEGGLKFNVNTLKTWGKDGHGPYLVPYSAEKEQEYATQIDFARSVNAVKRVLSALGDRSQNLRFRDLTCARNAEQAAITFYETLVDIGVLNLPKVKVG